MNLALCPDGEFPEGLEGISTREPTFDLPAIWIEEEQREKAEMLGCTAVDAATVLLTHFTEILKRHAHELLTRQTVKEMVEMCIRDRINPIQIININYSSLVTFHCPLYY